MTTDDLAPVVSVPDAIALPAPLHDPTAPPTPVPGLGATQYNDHATVSKLINDPRMVIDHTCPVFGVERDQLRERDPNTAAMVAAQPARHAALRRLVAGPFSAHGVTQRTPRITEIATDLIAIAASWGQPFDLVAELSRPLPTRVMMEILGVLPHRYAEVSAGAWEFNAAMMGATDVANIADRADREVWAWWDQIIDEHRSWVRADDWVPGGVLTTMLRAERDGYQVDGRTIDQTDMVGMCNFLMSAGTATVSAALATAVLLIADAGVAPRLRDDPDLIGAAVWESLRLETSFPLMLRAAADAVTVNGYQLPRGSLALASVAAAGRDPRVFPDPDSFRLDRDNLADHLEFGVGRHRCLGAHLAVAEMRVALAGLLRLPGLRVVEVGPRVFPALVPHTSRLIAEVVPGGQWAVTV